MDTVGLGYFTHKQLERLLGGGARAKQQRRRLVSRGVLPDPTWLRVDRTRLAIFPEFSLAVLVAAAPQRTDACREISRRAAGLYSSSAFTGLKEAMEAAVRLDRSAVDQPGVLGGYLMETASGVLEQWQQTVRELEAELRASHGLRIGVDAVQVAEVREDAYVVRSRDGGAKTDVATLAAADQLVVGAWASLDRVSLLSARREFLLGAPQGLSVGVDDGLAASLAGLMTAGAPTLPADFDESLEPALALRRHPRERSAWRGANTMRRVGAGR